MIASVVIATGSLFFHRVWWVWISARRGGLKVTGDTAAVYNTQIYFMCSQINTHVFALQRLNWIMWEFFVLTFFCCTTKSGKRHEGRKRHGKTTQHELELDKQLCEHMLHLQHLLRNSGLCLKLVHRSNFSPVTWTDLTPDLSFSQTFKSVKWLKISMFIHQ